MSFYHRLTAEGVPTDGVVTAPDCGNHNTVKYAFEAGGQTVNGLGQPDSPCNALRAGDELTVWYLPSQPSNNWPGEPSRQLDNEQISVALAAVVMQALLIGTVAIKLWLRKRAKAATPADGREIEM